jgi:hypothetical protein
MSNAIAASALVVSLGLSGLGFITGIPANTPAGAPAQAEQ